MRSCPRTAATGEPSDNENGDPPEPFSASLRWDEFRHGGVSDYILGAETCSHDEAEQNQDEHRRREGGGNGRETEDCEVRLVGEAPAVAVAKEARKQCP